MRDQYLDSSKAILIFLVVWGHFLERFIGWGEPTSHTLLGVIYFIHMPAFIFISGLLFKDKNWFKNIIFFLSLYLPFQFLFPAFDALWTGKFNFNWINWFERPYWVLWYLMGMMVWTLFTYFLKKMPLPVLASLALALFVGLSPWNNYQYSIGRIFVFLPFFVIGHMYGKIILQSIQDFKFSTIIGLFVLLGIVALVYTTHLNQYWLYGSLSYRQLKVSVMDGTLIRAGCLLVSSLGVCAIFSLSKLIKSHFIQLGVHTLPVYLLHGFVVIFLSHYLKLNFNIGLKIFICLLLALLTCWVLQQVMFDRLLRYLSLWLMKPTEKLWHKKITS